MKRITTLTGPSCAGKTTLERMMTEKGALRAISTTTRQPRAGEQDGVDYYFVSQDKFETLRKLDMLVECVQFGENWYGLCTSELERLFMQGDHIVIVCEPVGAKQINKYCRKRSDIMLHQVFVDNPREVIIRRAAQRFLQDYTHAKVKNGSAGAAAALDAYCKRMVIMTTVEAGWIAEAYDSAHPLNKHRNPEDFQYDTLLAHFDETNSESATLLLMH